MRTMLLSPFNPFCLGVEQQTPNDSCRLDVYRNIALPDQIVVRHLSQVSYALLIDANELAVSLTNLPINEHPTDIVHLGVADDRRKRIRIESQKDLVGVEQDNVRPLSGSEAADLLIQTDRASAAHCGHFQNLTVSKHC